MSQLKTLPQSMWLSKRQPTFLILSVKKKKTWSTELFNSWAFHTSTFIIIQHRATTKRHKQSKILFSELSVLTCSSTFVIADATLLTFNIDLGHLLVPSPKKNNWQNWEGWKKPACWILNHKVGYWKCKKPVNRAIAVKTKSSRYY